MNYYEYVNERLYLLIEQPDPFQECVDGLDRSFNDYQ
jgi:hypothetical protein